MKGICLSLFWFHWLQIAAGQGRFHVGPERRWSRRQRQPTCTADRWLCKNNMCVLNHHRCDGVNHCGDGSEEQGCETYTCPTDRMKCKNNVCVPKGSRCNGLDDCGDASDEQNCGPVRKSNGGTLSLVDGRIDFTLTAHPVPETFAFKYIGDNLDGDGNEQSSARFSFECKADPKTTYTVYCSIVPVNVPKQFLGLYSGSVSNTVGSIDIKFQIRKEDSAVVRNLTLNDTTETVTAKGEDRVTLSLTCWAYGQPPPRSLTIYKDNIAVISSEVQYHRTGKWDYMVMVTLSEVQCRDKGTYTCTTNNGIGDPDSRSISLNVTHAPQQILPAILNPVDGGLSFKLKACPIPETFLFTHHGSSVDKGRISFGCEKDTVGDSAVSCLITPLDVPKQELGSYAVAVSNGEGSVDIMFTIHEEDRAVITNLTLNNASETLTVRGDAGVTLHIICTVIGRPAPKHVTITRGYTTFGPRDVQYQRTENLTRQAVVTLPAVQCRDMGAYTCEADNGIVGSDTRKIQLNVECPPRKIFDDTLTMKDGRLAFSLAAYPAPDRVVFFHLGNQTSARSKMSGQFSSGCEQDRVTEFTVNCEVTLLDDLENVEGLYMAEMYNDLGKVEVKFFIQEREDKPLMGQWAALGAVGFFISIAIVVAVIVICRRRNNVNDRISGLYEEIDNNDARERHRAVALLAPPANRPTMPQLPEAGVPIRIIDEQRHIDAVQNRPLPSTPDAGASFSTDHEQSTLQAEELEMGALGAMLSSGNDYDQAQQTSDNDNYMYSPLNTSSCSQSNDKEDPTSAEPDDASSTDDYYLHPIADSPAKALRTTNTNLHPV